MGDLATDTAVEQTGSTTFSCDLSPDWEIWGPNGGYLASVATACGRRGQRTRPPGVDQRPLRRGRPERTGRHRREVNRATRVATSVTVRITQEGRPLLVATVWGVDGDLDGLEHHTKLGPHDVRTHPSSKRTQELLGVQDGSPRHPFWDNIEQRPTEWIDDWENREVSEPSTRAWVQFVPTATFADPWVDACRSLILIDLDSWPSAMSSASRRPRALRADDRGDRPLPRLDGGRTVAVERGECPGRHGRARRRCRPGLDTRSSTRRARRQHLALSSRRPPPRPVSPPRP